MASSANPSASPVGCLYLILYSLAEQALGFNPKLFLAELALTGQLNKQILTKPFSVVGNEVVVSGPCWARTKLCGTATAAGLILSMKH